MTSHGPGNACNQSRHGGRRCRPTGASQGAELPPAPSLIEAGGAGGKGGVRNVKNDPPLPRPVGKELGGKQRGLGQRHHGHAAPLPRPHPGCPQAPLATRSGATRPPEGARSPHRSQATTGRPTTLLLPACRREHEGAKNGDGPALAITAAVPTLGSGRRAQATAAGMDGPSHPWPSAAAPGEQRARTRMEARGRHRRGRPEGRQCERREADAEAGATASA